MEGRTDYHDINSHYEVNNNGENDYYNIDYNKNELNNHDHNSDKNKEQKMVYLKGLLQTYLEFCIALLCIKAC